MKSLNEGRARFSRLTGAVVLCGLVLLGMRPAWAQPVKREIKEPIVEQSFSIRQDEDLFQLEEAITLIASSLNKIADKANTLAINSFHFGKEVDADFRRKAEVIILEKLFEASPSVRLVQCQECQRLETKIVRGILKLRKGIPSNEARQALAKKLGVDGFIDIGIFRDHNQITVYLKIVEAESGAIILVDELAGRRAPKREALTFSFGEMNFPISSASASADHKALVIGANETVQLTDRFSFGVDLNLYTDNNANNQEKIIELDVGIVLAPYLAYDVLRLQASTSRLLFYIGIGKL
ncbi:MAG: hypothetical protein O6934_03845, partial [SAR324 cluster bacterium]|nr:hypothetical protein [SAR324 cluster bacterium]